MFCFEFVLTDFLYFFLLLKRFPPFFPEACSTPAAALRGDVSHLVLVYLWKEAFQLSSCSVIMDEDFCDVVVNYALAFCNKGHM